MVQKEKPAPSATRAGECATLYIAPGGRSPGAPRLAGCAKPSGAFCSIRSYARGETMATGLQTKSTCRPCANAPNAKCRGSRDDSAVAAIFVTRAQADRSVSSFCAELPKQFNPQPAGQSDQYYKTIIALTKDKNKKRREWHCPLLGATPMRNHECRV